MLCLPWPHGDEPAFRPTSGQQEWLLTTDTQSLYSLDMSVRNRSCSNDIGSRGHRPKMTKRTSPTMMTAAIATRSRNVFGP